MSRPVDIGICAPCGKRLWETRTDARKARKLYHPSERMHAYPCPAGMPGYHLGHLPAAVRLGDAGREDIGTSRRTTGHRP